MSITIRVYGLILENGSILLTDEFRMGMKMTKFPGGGLDEGEGIIDCLKREIREELNSEITDYQHFYTTDFYQKSLFHPGNLQVINIYYLIKIEKPYNFKTSDVRFDFEQLIEGAQTFRWVKSNELTEEDVDLPIDKHLIKLLRNKDLQLPNVF